MKLEEYEETGMALYGDFAMAVEAIIRAALAAHPSIRTQQIQRRSKSVDSLRKKLGGVEVSAIEDVVKDLAGVRVILYANSDIDRFNRERVLFENFDIVWDRTKLHYPVGPEASDAQAQFIGDNYVLRLKENRASLPEYNRFAGLVCEVQLQTILNHAWSETAHDTIYKSPKLEGVGAAQMDKLRERMRGIQQKYLLPAGYEFQQVLNDFERITGGQRLVDNDVLAAIRDANDNNVRVELLEQYESLVLPIIDDASSAAPQIRSALIAAFKNAVASPVIPIETPIGPLRGREPSDVLEKALSILGAIRYVEPPEAYDTYVQLFLSTPDQTLRGKILEAVSELAKHSLSVWQRFGPAVQEILLAKVAATPPERLTLTRPLMIAVAGECLAPEATGTSSTSTTFTWQTGAVIVSDRLNAIRDKAMALLKDLLGSSQDDSERRRILSALENATRLPNQGNYSDALLERALLDTANLINFLRENLHRYSQEFRQSIEHDVFHKYRRSQNMPNDVMQNPDIVAANDAVAEAALALRDALGAIEEYVIFKTLVGYETVFDYEWDQNDDIDVAAIEAKDQHRKMQAANLLAKVDDANADQWFARLNAYAAIDSQDRAYFPQLGAFIADLAQARPNVAQTWLTQARGQPLAKFNPGLLRGLYAADVNAARAWVEGAMARGEDLSGVAVFLEHADPVLPDLLEAAAAKAVELEDDAAAFAVLQGAVRRASDFGMALARTLILDMVEFLHGRRRYRWTQPIWLWAKGTGLLLQLDETQRTRLFAAMTELPEIDFHAEEILAAFAQDYAGDIIDLFGKRLEHERRDKEGDSDDDFDALPYDFHILHAAMARTGRLAFEKAFGWYLVDPQLAQFRSARFIANLFPEPAPDIIGLMTDLAHSSERERQEFLIEIVTNYDGAAFVHSVLRELVATLPAADVLLLSVRGALGATGMMHGEFGYRDALVAEKAALEPWLEDERETVRAFAANLMTRLDNDIAAAQKSAETDIAMRRLDHGEPLGQGE